MPPLTDLRFRLLRERRTPFWIWAVAVAVHVPVVVILLATLWRHTTEGWRLYDLRLTPDSIATAPVSFAIAAPRAAAPVRSPVTRPAPRRPEPVAGSATTRVTEMPPPPVAQQGLPVPPANDLPAGGGNAAPVAPGRVPAAVPPIGPAYGSGVLWGHNAPASAELLAQRVLGVSQGRGLDSATTARLQRYIDSMATEVSANQPPSWVTSIGGKKIGVDQKWIYLGPLKIPAALLALLPISTQANPTQAEYNKRLGLMQEDLFFAAQRAQNYAEFRSNVAKLRAEKEAERQFKANQRGGTPPPEKHWP